MARTERGLRVKRRLQGVGFLVVVFLLLALTVAIYKAYDLSLRTSGTLSRFGANG